jgi:hypothetical protein
LNSSVTFEGVAPLAVISTCSTSGSVKAKRTWPVVAVPPRTRVASALVAVVLASRALATARAVPPRVRVVRECETSTWPLDRSTSW